MVLVQRWGRQKCRELVSGGRVRFVRVFFIKIQGFTPNCRHLAVKLDRIDSLRPPSSLLL